MWIDIQSVKMDIGSIRIDIQCNVGIWTGQDRYTECKHGAVECQDREDRDVGCQDGHKECRDGDASCHTRRCSISG
jgi:hypothetical protein